MSRPSFAPEAGASSITGVSAAAPSLLHGTRAAGPANLTDAIWVIDATGRVCRAHAFPAITRGLWRATSDPRDGSDGDLAPTRWFHTERAATLAAIHGALTRSRAAALAFRQECALHHELQERLQCLPLAEETEDDWCSDDETTADFEPLPDRPAFRPATY